MKHRRKLFPLVALAACFGLVFTSAIAQDPLKRGKGGGGGSGGGEQKRSDPPRQDPPKREDPPKRQDPPRQDPPRNDPPRRQDPPRNDPPRTDPPKYEPPQKQDDPLRRGRGGGSVGGGNSGGSNSGGSSSGGSNSGGSTGRGNDSGSRGGGMRDFPTRGDQRGSDRGGVISGPNRGNDDSMLGKKSGRSGSVKYGSNSNGSRDGRSGMRIDRAPININRGSLGQQVRRSDDIRFGTEITVGSTRIRFGYTHYNSRWCDDYFYYPYYVFDPYRNDFACSPWYYYANLPPYFATSRCYFPTRVLNWAPFYGVRYRWNQPSRDYWNRDYNELDYVVQDIVDAFMNGDRRAIQRLTPRNGQVGIITDGTYMYSLRADDFYDTLMDAVENTNTRDYKILDVQYRRDTASVFARHDFDDPWGRRVSVNHYFKLEADGRDWVIREFGTSNNRW